MHYLVALGIFLFAYATYLVRKHLNHKKQQSLYELYIHQTVNPLKFPLWQQMHNYQKNVYNIFGALNKQNYYDLDYMMENYSEDKILRTLVTDLDLQQTEFQPLVISTLGAKVLKTENLNKFINYCDRVMNNNTKVCLPINGQLVVLIKQHSDFYMSAPLNLMGKKVLEEIS